MSGGDGLGGAAFAIMLVMGTLIVLPAALLIVLLRWYAKSHPVPTAWFLAAALIGLSIGAAVTFFVVFDDLGKQWLAGQRAPRIVLEVPEGFRGRVYLYTSNSTPGPSAQDGAFHLRVSAEGVAVIGPYPHRDESFTRNRYAVIFPDGKEAETQPVSMSGGGFDNVLFASFFVGTAKERDDDDARREKNGTQFDEQEVYRNFVKPSK